MKSLVKKVREKMLKKIDQAQLFIEKNANFFRCPLCHQGMQSKEYSLICESGHRFDLSKKGTLFFLKQGHVTEYSKEMFQPRGRMIQAGMYQPVLDVVASWLTSEMSILDVGCGEGSFLSLLKDKVSFQTGVGFDISKEGIYLASNQPGENFYCVADLTNLPFADQSFTCLLNIFTPSHYQEFQRVLQKDGFLLKIVPQSCYLKELRAAFYPDQKDKQSYSNQAVVQKLSEKMAIVQQKRVTYSFDVPEENRLDLLSMSPLEWQVSPERKQFLSENPLRKITIDVDVIKAVKKMA